jgi:vesicle-fusing ATPase
MTALESYPGIVLLATNLRGNIDSAFLRRIRHVVEFAKPDAPARERIWRQVVQVLFPAQEAQRLDPELARLAQVEATGAVIKHAALSALFAVRYERREADLRVLGAMLARELAKEGAGLSPRELDALTGGRA